MKLNISNKVTLMKAQARFLAGRAREKVEELLKDESGMGTVEVILIIVEKPNAKHRYVLCGN